VRTPRAARPPRPLLLLRRLLLRRLPLRRLPLRRLLLRKLQQPAL